MIEAPKHDSTSNNYLVLNSRKNENHNKTELSGLDPEFKMVSSTDHDGDTIDDDKPNDNHYPLYSSDEVDRLQIKCQMLKQETNNLKRNICIL